MLFPPEILTWFFSNILSLAGDFSLQLASVSVPILGSNFLHHHAFLIDVARARVWDSDPLDVLSAISSPAVYDPFCAHLQQAP